jgi:GMP synthase (glutamine-hydrolysing)
MRLLIVEGNNEETRVQRGAFGIKPYHLLFKEMLHSLVPNADTESVFPADGTKDLPSISQLEGFDGILWTGSSLSVTDTIPAVIRQLDFAETIFKSGTPLYGSCWGLQVATVAAGGEVGPSTNGLEFGISKSIELTQEGVESPFFNGRSSNYTALCIHYDEVLKLPQNAVVLASNAHSPIQAVIFDHKKSSFFGVQYHPEFNSEQMALITSFLEEKLVGSDSFASIEEVRAFAKRLSGQNNLPPEVYNYSLHTNEIRAWLNYIAKN